MATPLWITYSTSVQQLFHNFLDEPLQKQRDVLRAYGVSESHGYLSTIFCDVTKQEAIKLLEFKTNQMFKTVIRRRIGRGVPEFLLVVSPGGAPVYFRRKPNKNLLELKNLSTKAGMALSSQQKIQILLF